MTTHSNTEIFFKIEIKNCYTWITNFKTLEGIFARTKA
ncbi:hypothetical protein CBN_0210 [Clostridium botulinum NCTC 2916]|nr:hypothetical protein CBN_0210 [Clostridium botulinum NCTC 2916]